MSMEAGRQRGRFRKAKPIPGTYGRVSKSPEKDPVSRGPVGQEVDCFVRAHALHASKSEKNKPI